MKYVENSFKNIYSSPRSSQANLKVNLIVFIFPPIVSSQLQDAKEGNRTAAKDVPNLKSPAATAFLQALGIQANQNGEYASCDNNPSEIQGAYRGTFGLWGAQKCNSDMDQGTLTLMLQVVNLVNTK